MGLTCIRSLIALVYGDRILGDGVHFLGAACCGLWCVFLPGGCFVVYLLRFFWEVNCLCELFVFRFRYAAMVVVF
jgi:hypothetical protein